MFENLSEDLDVYCYCAGLPRWASFLMIIVYPVTWPIIVYRFGNWIVYKCKIPIFKQLVYLVYFALKRIVELLTGVEIGPTAKIGKGLCIKHLGNVIIGHNSNIGEYCTIINNVTIGASGRRENYGVPNIGNYVYIGTGAVIIGKINIGNCVAIGANAVVVNPVPDNAVVGGVPARILNYNGSLDYLRVRSKCIDISAPGK